MQDHLNKAASFVRKHPDAARAIVAAGVAAATKHNDPAALVYQGAANLAAASKKNTLLGLDTDELQSLLLEQLGDLAGELIGELLS